ncbi:hypothetical protein A1O1_07594 [Capronia coronata CBS 617.96]|uniref:Glycerate dehydrogenase n=1 Tax=Capronia coronata CBS 617.96 TaxID=1182541 RepID=W9XW07_9EURO|nr:uncharacterized protein A1O1_07594 [Capronia coronata CBS 617.96]EXJ81530.1 hypothetical protein A1O1_07594 [Capronia coronata CBS 617.96]
MSVTGSSRIKIVALEAQFGPIPEFDGFNGEYDITIYDQTPRDDVKVLNERIRDADIAIITTMPLAAATLSAEVTPRLRAIMIMAAGTDHVDLEYCRNRGIRVLNSPRANTTTVAEHAIALYFATRRCIVQTHIRTVDDQWPKKRTLLSSLRDRDNNLPLGVKDEVVGIIGYGGVGKHIAKLCLALGMTVLIADRKTSSTQQTTPSASGSDGMSRSSFADILAKCTVIFVAIPRLPTTLDTISEAELAQMNSRAVLINVSRGGIVNENDLLSALRTRQIAGAATDVFVTEPASTENSVLLKALADESAREDGEKLPLVVTPHTAWYSEVTMENLVQDVKDNVIGWSRGVLPPENLIV